MKGRTAPGGDGRRTILGALVLLSVLPLRAAAGAGTEGAAFLDIPVGARPAALGGAYSALAEDAYAPVWNPAGLGFLQAPEFAAMHLSYLAGISYDYAGLVDRVNERNALGASLQYFHTNPVRATDAAGNPTSDFTSYAAVYSLAYGRSFGDHVAAGAAGKLATTRIAGSTGRAWAGDLGVLLKPNERLTLAFVAAQLGTRLAYDGQGDSLPRGLRAAAAYEAVPGLRLALEERAAVDGASGLHAGAEWTLYDALALRGGYATENKDGLGFPAGLTMGLGLRLWGQDFDYAWVPFGDLGDTQYFSLVIRFGAPPRPQAATPDSPRAFEGLIRALDHERQATEPPAP